jgi:ribose 5-phosphate isomerase
MDDDDDELTTDDVDLFADVGGYWAEIRIVTECATKLLTISDREKMSPNTIAEAVSLSLEILDNARDQIDARIARSKFEESRSNIEPS